jgi:hypothetical protein
MRLETWPYNQNSAFCEMLGFRQPSGCAFPTTGHTKAIIELLVETGKSD